MKSLNHIMVAKVAALILMLIFSFNAFAIGAMAGESTLERSQPYQDSFDVGKYLKINDGQTYLEEDAQKEGVVIDFIIKFIKLLTTIIGSFALLFVIIGGFVLMVSHGSSEMQRKGKTIIMYAAIGLAVAFLSLIIVTFVQSLFYQE